MPRTIGGKHVTQASKVFQEGDDFWHQGNYDEARTCYGKAAKLYNESEDLEGEAFVLSRLGELELSLDNYDEAEKALSSAVEIVRNVELAENTFGESLLKLSKVLVAKKQYEKAWAAAKEAEKILQEIGNRDLLGELHDHEAYVHLLQGNEKEALKAYGKAASMFRQEGITLKEASVLRAMARLEMKNKNYDVAHDILERCRDLYRENGDLLGEASALSAIGSLRYIIRDIENARKALMKAVYLYGKAEHHFAEAEALLYLARVEAFSKEQGDYERAKIHYKKSIELYDFMQNEVMKKAVLDEYYNFLNRISV